MSWKCSKCGVTFPDSQQVLEIRFGYVDDNDGEFVTDNSAGPFCDPCAIAVIKGEGAEGE